MNTTVPSYRDATLDEWNLDESGRPLPNDVFSTVTQTVKDRSMKKTPSAPDIYHRSRQVKPLATFEDNGKYVYILPKTSLTDAMDLSSYCLGPDDFYERESIRSISNISEDSIRVEFLKGNAKKLEFVKPPFKVQFRGKEVYPTTVKSNGSGMYVFAFSKSHLRETYGSFARIQDHNFVPMTDCYKVLGFWDGEHDVQIKVEPKTVQPIHRIRTDETYRLTTEYPSVRYSLLDNHPIKPNEVYTNADRSSFMYKLPRSNYMTEYFFGSTVRGREEKWKISSTTVSGDEVMLFVDKEYPDLCRDHLKPIETNLSINWGNDRLRPDRVHIDNNHDTVFEFKWNGRSLRIPAETGHFGDIYFGDARLIAYRRETSKDRVLIYTRDATGECVYDGTHGDYEVKVETIENVCKGHRHLVSYREINEKNWRPLNSGCWKATYFSLDQAIEGIEKRFGGRVEPVLVTHYGVDRQVIDGQHVLANRVGYRSGYNYQFVSKDQTFLFKGGLDKGWEAARQIFARSPKPEAEYSEPVRESSRVFHEVKPDTQEYLKLTEEFIERAKASLVEAHRETVKEQLEKPRFRIPKPTKFGWAAILTFAALTVGSLFFGSDEKDSSSLSERVRPAAVASK